jgi:radical SAM-linked protein
VYVPSLYELETDPETGFLVVARGRTPEARLPVKRTFLASLAEHPFPAGGPVAATETVFDRVSVEVARGCTEGCRFCQAGMIYRPVRERPPEQIVDVIEEATTEGGYDEASLTSLSTADYSAITPLVKNVVARLDGKRVSLSVSSLRAYGLGEDVLDEMKKNRATGLTFAPEAGTQRMRDVVNKNVTEEQLLETAERVFSRGWSKMKLYFMIGLPTEEEEDVRGIVQTGQRALDVGRRIQGKSTPRVTVSVSTHVPKPHTPFQWCAMDDHETIVEKQEMLRDEARRSGVKLRTHGSEGSWLEGVLARGDRRLADVIESAWKRGARFDSWEEHLDVEAWRTSFEEHAIDTTPYLGTIPVTARLPWDHIDVGLEPGFLAKEYRKALKNRLSPPCGKVVGAFVHPTNVEDAEAQTRKLVCYDCGVACDLDQMKHERLVFLRTLGAEKRPAPREEPAEITTPKQRQRVVTPDQGPALRVRLGYTRLGRQAYSSHLDLVRLLPRLFRRARLPLYYSQGFHPKPVMVFGPSLPLGIASLCEHVDVKLRAELAEGLDEGEVLARLAGVGLDGLDFFGARLLGANDPALGKVVDEIEYVVGLARDALDALSVRDADELGALIDARRAAGGLVVRRDVKGVGKRVDVGSYLREARVGEGGEALRAAGILGELVPLRLAIAMDQTGTARAAEAVEVLTGRGDLSFRIVRSAMRGGRSGEQLDPLAAVGRIVPPAKAQAEPPGVHA